MKRGFTLIEMLVGLLFVPMILTISISILSVLNIKETKAFSQANVFELQIRQYLLQANDVIFENEIIVGTYNGKAFEIFFDRNRLVKRPGYEILLADVMGVDVKGSCFNVYLKEGSLCVARP